MMPSVEYSTTTMPRLIADLGGVAGAGQPVLGEHQPLHDPRLPAALGEQPAGGGHQERRHDRPGRHPEEHLGRLELLAPEQEHPPQPDQEHQGGDVGHHPHRPVLDEHVRHVVAGAVLLVVLGVDLAQALHLAVPGAGGQDRQQVRDFDDLDRRFVLVVAADLDHRERTRLAGVPVGLGCGDLHRLVVRLVDAEPAADRELQRPWQSSARTIRASRCCGTIRRGCRGAGARPTPRAARPRRRSTQPRSHARSPTGRSGW